MELVGYDAIKFRIDKVGRTAVVEKFSGAAGRSANFGDFLRAGKIPSRMVRLRGGPKTNDNNLNAMSKVTIELPFE